jgi:hypothetical protein
MGIKVTAQNGAEEARDQINNNNGQPHVYIGACPGNFDPGTAWESEVSAFGMPPQGIVWGLGETMIHVRDNEFQQTHCVEGTPYGVGDVVCMRVRDGMIEFYLTSEDNMSGTPRFVAALPFTHASLRPFVAVSGHALRCSVVSSLVLAKPASTRPIVETILQGACAFRHACMYVRTWALACVYKCIHTYIHAYIHTRAHEAGPFGGTPTNSIQPSAYEWEEAFDQAKWPAATDTLLVRYRHLFAFVVCNSARLHCVCHLFESSLCWYSP